VLPCRSLPVAGAGSDRQVWDERRLDRPTLRRLAARAREDAATPWPVPRACDNWNFQAWDAPHRAARQVGDDAAAAHAAAQRRPPAPVARARSPPRAPASTSTSPRGDRPVPST
jgi:hypothetical protein